MAIRCLSTVAVILAMLLAGTSGACDSNGKIKVTLVVILASEEPGPIDPRLKAIAAEVQTLNPSLKSFQLKTMSSKSLAEAEKAKFTLVENKAVEITVQHSADKNNKVALAILPPDQGEIVYRTVCGKFLPFVTRCRTKSKQRVIFAVRVQPCLGD